VRFEVHAEGGDHRALIVILHGLFGNAERMRGVHALTRELYPEADHLLPRFSGGALSNGDPRLIASAIEDEIDRLHRLHRYDKIVLIGYSAGSLIIRKAYLWGHGGAHGVDRPGGATPRHDWVDSVDRIVLLAGMNRGWSISPKDDEPDAMPLPMHERLAYWLGKRFGELTGTGRLARSVERGAPFVADLRVQWIRFARPPGGAAPSRVAPVIQLLGDIDTVVSGPDSKDVKASKDFVYIPLTQTDHATMLDVLPDPSRPDRAELARHRADKLREAIGARTADLRERYATTAAPENATIEHVIFVVHGIRDFGDWTANIEAEIAGRAGARERYKVIRSSYGYFPMGKFLVLGARQVNVRWFMDQYTQALAEYPRAAAFSYVGHSNGTYLLASALETYRSLKVHRVLFAGSVVRTRYGWSDLIARPEEDRRVHAVRNVVASEDLVVGVFPRMFELLTELSPAPLRTGHLLDIGAAGFRGFTEAQHNVKFVAGGHGAAIDTKNRAKAIVDFILDGDESGFGAFHDASTVPAWADWASKLCWIVWLLLLGLVLLGGYAFASVAPVPAGWNWLLYALIVLLLLNTV
jgi:pimeloyl-ACP methyl ester carboxylesterase